MKGKLIKDHEGWWVQHKAKGLDGNLEYIAESMLHPEDVKQIEEDAKVFDNIEARIAAYPNVEFEIVRYCKYHNSDPSKNSVCTLDCGYDEVSYAKLIPSKEQQKQLITEIMEEDAKDGLYDTVNDTVSELDKLAEKTFKGDDATTFVQREIWKDGYNKAKEILYTEEDMLNAFYDGWLSKDLIWKVAKKLFKESLKQPKKD